MSWIRQALRLVRNSLSWKSLRVVRHNRRVLPLSWRKRIFLNEGRRRKWWLKHCFFLLFLPSVEKPLHKKVSNFDRRISSKSWNSLLVVESSILAFISLLLELIESRGWLLLLVINLTLSMWGERGFFLLSSSFWKFLSSSYDSFLFDCYLSLINFWYSS